MNILEYSEVLDIPLVISYNGGRFNAKFEAAEVKDGPVLSSVYGSGNTVLDAVNNYTRRIRGEIIIFNAYSNNFRRQVQVPSYMSLLETI